MAEDTFEASYNQLLTRFQAGEYQWVVDVGAENLARFPEDRAHINYLRICALARLAELEQACAMLDAMLDDTGWLSEAILRDSPSFKPLQGRPDFEALVQKSLRLRTENALTAPPGITLLPDAAPPYPAFICLHGNAGSPRTEVGAWKPLVAWGWLLGMAGSSQGHFQGVYLWDDTDRAAQEVRAYAADLAAAYPLDPARTVLGGFSMGAAVAVHLALTGVIPTRGFVALAPYIAAYEDWDALIAATGQELRGYIIVDAEDHSYADIQAFVEKLRARGLACELEVCTGSGHTYPPAFDESLRRGLEFVLG